MSSCQINAAGNTTETRCKKLDRILSVLSQDFPPFNQLSSERLSEVLNQVRLLELRPGELMQLSGSQDNDYLFVIEGSVELICGGINRSIVSSHDASKRPAMLSPAPVISTIIALQPSIICHADRKMLDDMISWDAVVFDLPAGDEKIRERMELVRNSLVFRRLPWESVEAAFERMQTVSAKAGETIIKQGEQGNAFYIITSGRAEVWGKGIMDDTPQKLAEIGEGDAFGCEALISGQNRSETVHMLEDGTLLVLGKDDFDWLIKKQMIKAVNPKVARTMMETGYKFLDVRYQEEFEYNHIPGAALIPLFELRKRMDELNINEHYIIYCQSGSRSSVAALRLSQAGFDVQTLEGGIREWPYETLSMD